MSLWGGAFGWAGFWRLDHAPKRPVDRFRVFVRLDLARHVQEALILSGIVGGGWGLGLACWHRVTLPQRQSNGKPLGLNPVVVMGTPADYRPSMRIILPCLVAAGLLINDGKASAYTISGVGTVSCGSWTAYRRTPTSTLAMGVESWILGFLSGVGFEGVANADPLNGTDAEGVWAWIDNYCRANPLKDVEDAGVAFVYAHQR